MANVLKNKRVKVFKIRPTLYIIMWVLFFKNEYFNKSCAHTTKSYYTLFTK